MALRDKSFRQSYDSDQDDILSDFYLPALAEAVQYDRLSGFFSSTSLAVAAKGVASFIANGGRMRILTSPHLSAEDLAAVRSGLASLQTALEASVVRELSSVTERFVKDHLSALSWMIANGRLELRLAVVLDEGGLPSVQGSFAGIFHPKVGILIDQQGERLSFSGSENESASGWIGNVEEFKVFRGWVEQERPYLDSDIERFERFWNNGARRVRVFSISESTIKQILKVIPPDLSPIALERYAGNQGVKRSSPLWPYQKEAISKWRENSFRGILEMATGTGKTFTALGARDALRERVPRLLTVVASPTIHLCEQWARSLKSYGYEGSVVQAHSGVQDWMSILRRDLLDLRAKVIDQTVVLTTHATFSDSAFIDAIAGGSRDEALLIVDEVHGAGAPLRQAGLARFYAYRLGLSATPSRWFDDHGTSELMSYFGGVIYEFGLRAALESANPSTGKTFLCPYYYHPLFVVMSEEEYAEYERQSKNLARAYHASRTRAEREQALALLANKRENIVRNATEKLAVLEALIRKHKDVKHGLIYCSPQQILLVQDILNRAGVVQHKFTYHESTRPNQRYGGLSEREFILRQFSAGNYQYLVAMKCLDEGVDIPEVRLAIILSSTGNPREYIQRRGRLLRWAPGKDAAIIYDLFVLPGKRLGSRDLAPLEKAIVSKQLRRLGDFASTAINRNEILGSIHRIEEEYGVLVKEPDT